MDLRELRKEVQELPSIEYHLRQFQEFWLKPLKVKDSHLVQSLDSQTQQELKKHFAALRDTFIGLRDSEVITQRLGQSARHLVELKLSTLQGDTKKAKALAKQLLHDEFLSLPKTITQIKEFENHLSALSVGYRNINALVEKKLPLEHAVAFHSSSHHHHLGALGRIKAKQQELALELGHHFVLLTKEAVL